MRRPYPTDLSDAEWFCIEPYLPTPKAPGRPRVHSLREILNAIYYIVRSGCAWRLLPHEFPPWKTIHHYFRTWRLEKVPGSSYTLLFVIVCEYVLRGILNQVRAHSGFPVSKDYRSRRRAGLRRRKEGKGAKTALAGGHRRPGAKGKSTCS